MPRTGKNDRKRRRNNRTKKQSKKQTDGESGSSSYESSVASEDINLLTNLINTLTSAAKENKSIKKKKSNKTEKADPIIPHARPVKAKAKGPYDDYSSFEILQEIIKALTEIPLPAVDDGVLYGTISAKTIRRVTYIPQFFSKYLLMVNAGCRALDELRREHEDQKIIESVEILVKTLKNFLKDLLNIEIDKNPNIIEPPESKYVKDYKESAEKALDDEFVKLDYILNEKIIRYLNETCS